jgi:hypothetical protein
LQENDLATPTKDFLKNDLNLPQKNKNKNLPDFYLKVYR